MMHGHIYNIMCKAASAFAVLLSVLFISSCDKVHEFPEIPERVSYSLRLEYELPLPIWEHYIEINSRPGTTRAVQTEGQMRYVIRLYPRDAASGIVSSRYTEEYVFYRDLSEGYDTEVTLDAPAGDYEMRVWSDLLKDPSDMFYDYSDFSRINIRGRHVANTDYRDAFRGSHNITLLADIYERLPESYIVKMQRPLAKYEFITNDLIEFARKEAQRIESKNNAGSSVTTAPVQRINYNDYRVVFYYVGFMQDTYSMFTDKQVDAVTGITYESKLTQLNDSEASLGFDYVFIGNEETSVTVQIGLFHKDGTQLAMTQPIEVPIRRSWHTILRGRFLMSEASGGVVIDPTFDGDFNLVFP